VASDQGTSFPSYQMTPSRWSKGAAGAAMAFFSLGNLCPVLLRGPTPGMFHFLNESALFQPVQRQADKGPFGHDPFVHTQY